MAQTTLHCGNLPSGVALTRDRDACRPSESLTTLLVAAREAYEWPLGAGAETSQTQLVALEMDICRKMEARDPALAHEVVVSASQWAGNEATAHARIVKATREERAVMEKALMQVMNLAAAPAAVEALAALPGVGLVLATKLNRLSMPYMTAAVDEHSAAFFNALPVEGQGFATQFRLESEAAADRTRNTREYWDNYLPLLGCLTQALNAGKRRFTSAATGASRSWVPADVEMAAQYWWACNGASACPS
jgi:hypothetical protein